ncbi:MAG: hypothetical protein JWN34_2808 [Bryobacterales bacterium]|jgi:hypothetical protein|nr:hypothetical protein [Bryobacterales bacterium]
MELTLDVAAEICPFCRSVNLFPGFTKKEAYLCQNCGQERGRSELAGSPRLRRALRRNIASARTDRVPIQPR